MPPKLTNPLRPVARYRKGQAPLGAASDSDSDAEQQHQDDDDDASPSTGTAIKNESDDDDVEKKPKLSKKAGSGKMAVQLNQVQVDDKGGVLVGGRGESGRTLKEQQDEQGSSSEYETDSEDDKPTAPKPVFKPRMPKAESDEGSSEYETDSDEDAPAPIYKPVFVSKRNRDTIAERDAALDPEVVEQRRLAEQEERKKQSHNLVADSILREIAQKETAQVFPDVDDTDGLDPQAEFEEWKLRELTRLKRDKEAQYAREKEREEIEARRALPEALRMKEDTERAQKSRDEKKKGGQVFMQKYHHKGAFYTDSDVLKKHDYTAPTTSTNRNMESLPAAMQVRNFGKASQSKYTHLAKEDTTSGDAGWNKKPGQQSSGGGQGCFTCGGPHMKKDCPQLNAGGGVGGAPSTSGANQGARDGGWGDRRPPSSRPGRDDDRDESAGRGGGGGGGGRDNRDWYADAGDRYARPPPRRDERERLDYGDDRRGGGGRGERYDRDERERGYSGDRRGGERDQGRRRSRSRSPPPRRERDERERNPRDRDDKRRRYD